ncbi:MAG: hypothetical protein JKY30_14250 [Flavobacteriales bacterium]|nr:hypothetical protein [Flavobacteriales bacterium]
MDRKIKVIWESSGPDAEETAKHHAIHLGEFGVREKLELSIEGTEYLSHITWIAYLIVFEKDTIKVRDALKPLRAEIFED